MEKDFSTKKLAERWIAILRHKARYEHDARGRGEVVASPDLDDICNEMTAYFTGIIKE